MAQGKLELLFLRFAQLVSIALQKQATIPRPCVNLEVTTEFLVQLIQLSAHLAGVVTTVRVKAILQVTERQMTIQPKNSAKKDTTVQLVLSVNSKKSVPEVPIVRPDLLVIIHVQEELQDQAKLEPFPLTNASPALLDITADLVILVMLRV